jgi:hypothetical protein
MGIALTEEFTKDKNEPAFYTSDELDLLYKLETEQVVTVSHEQAMENLRNVLGLTEK